MLDWEASDDSVFDDEDFVWKFFIINPNRAPSGEFSFFSEKAQKHYPNAPQAFKYRSGNGESGHSEYWLQNSEVTLERYLEYVKSRNSNDHIWGVFRVKVKDLRSLNIFLRHDPEENADFPEIGQAHLLMTTEFEPPLPKSERRLRDLVLARLEILSC